MVTDLEADLIAIRRSLHMYPELAREEIATTATVAQKLRDSGLTPRLLNCGTGLVCDVDLRAVDHRDALPGQMIALRADLDALPLVETSGAEYSSTHHGIAHACGHDVHTTVVLGAGIALAALAESSPLDAVVRLIFEPSEERLPGGAFDVVGEGWLDDVSAIVGLHCDPKIPVGVIGTRTGALTGAFDYFEVTLTGPGGHTSRPHLTVDLIAAMSKLIVALPERVNDLLDGSDEIVLVFGRAHSGDAPNVIPSEATCAATVRTHSTDVWTQCRTLVEKACADILDPTGAQWELTYHVGLPPVINDAAMTALVAEASRDVTGVVDVVEAPRSTGGDTFALYTQSVPGTYARLGTGDPKSSTTKDLHMPDFDIDEGAIAIGTEVLVRSTLRYLNQ